MSLLDLVHNPNNIVSQVLDLERRLGDIQRRTRATAGTIADTAAYYDPQDDSLAVPGDMTATEDLRVDSFLSLASPRELTIASGAVTADQAYHAIDTEDEYPTDDLDTISGGTDGDLLVVRSDNSERVVTLKDGTGNLQMSGDADLDTKYETALLVSNGTDWLELGHAEPAGPTPYVRQNLLYEHIFATGDLAGWRLAGSGWLMPEIVTEPTREGTYSCKCQVTKGDGIRCFTALKTDDTDLPPEQGDIFNFDFGVEYWIGWSVYLPADAQRELAQYGSLLMQLQPEPDAGEWYRSPIFMVALGGTSGQLMTHYATQIKWDTQAYRPAEDGNVYEGGVEYTLGSIVYGAWVDFVLQLKFSWGSDGFMTLWQDGVTVLHYEGPNCSNDTLGPRLGLGAYKWSYYPAFIDQSLATERTIYIDSIRIGDDNATYDDVAP